MKSEIYKNAVDSLEIGMKHFLNDNTYSSRKHSILTLFHSIELFLKEYLYQINPILIYKNIDSEIKEDSLTVSMQQILGRLDNVKLKLPKEQKKVIEKIRKRRNMIEHHRYDHKKEDDATIAESLRFIMFFVENILKRKLDDDLESGLLRSIQNIVFEYEERYWIASKLLDKWMSEKWPSWNPDQTDTPEPFSGTVDCPECNQTWMVIGYHKQSFCFHCNTAIDAKQCDGCGITHFTKDGCAYCEPEK